jgi:hypothetical protein
VALRRTITAANAETVRLLRREPFSFMLQSLDALAAMSWRIANSSCMAVAGVDL